MESSKRSECSLPGTSMALIDIICYTNFLKIIVAADCYNVSIVISFSSSSQSLCWLSFILPFITCSYLCRNLFLFTFPEIIYAFATCLLYTLLKKRTIPQKVIHAFFFDLLGKNDLCFAWLVSGAIVTMGTDDNSKGLFVAKDFLLAFFFVTLVS